MKQLILSLTFIILATLSSQAQVGINTASPNAGAALDVTSTDKGLLIPRVASTGDVTSPTAGMMVYQTGAPAGFYFYTTSWNLVGGSSGDNLGNHTATQNLNMGNNSITGASNITANYLVLPRTNFEITTLNNPSTTFSSISNSIIRFTVVSGYPNPSFTVLGIPGGVQGKIVTLYNSSSIIMSVRHNNTSIETSGNRIFNPENSNLETVGTGVVTLMYDTSLDSGNGGWLIISYVK